METNKGQEVFYAKNRQQWRQWLEKHGQSKKEVCLILYKKDSDTPSVSYPEAVEEALCFGWIDSLTNKRDEDSRYQRFSPRGPKSNWSKSNVDRVEKLIAAGLMTPHGQKHVDIAKGNGKWDAAIAAVNK